MKKMNFNDAIKVLNIEDYGERIFNSNSHGELFHLMDYIEIAEGLEDPSWFRAWFLAVIQAAEETWERPESVFQHIIRILKDTIK